MAFWEKTGYLLSITFIYPEAFRMRAFVALTLPLLFTSIFTSTAFAEAPEVKELIMLQRPDFSIVVDNVVCTGKLEQNQGVAGCAGLNVTVQFDTENLARVVVAGNTDGRDYLYFFKQDQNIKAFVVQKIPAVAGQADTLLTSSSKAMIDAMKLGGTMDVATDNMVQALGAGQTLEQYSGKLSESVQKMPSVGVRNKVEKVTSFDELMGSDSGTLAPLAVRRPRHQIASAGEDDAPAAVAPKKQQLRKAKPSEKGYYPPAPVGGGMQANGKASSGLY